MASDYSRRASRQLMLGSVPVGGNSPVSIQSMTNTITADASATVAQIQALAAKGCQIIRVAAAEITDVQALPQITSLSPIPVVADIHFDYRLAVGAMEAGVAGLRINPGNIGAPWKVKEVVSVAKERRIPIRIGVNGGSLERSLLDKYGGPTAAALVESALNHIHILEDLDYREMKLSLKSSSVPVMLAAYREIAAQTDYPLHLGVTETGLPSQGIVKSAVGVGALLAEGIGDTIRVSLTGDPMEEIAAARQILTALELIPAGLQIIACPTCGRTRVDLPSLVQSAEQKFAALALPAGRSLTLAIMGCAVNGPGEAREADFGIACGKEGGLLFAAGKPLKHLPETELVDALYDLVTSRLSDA
ncbi:MAG: flavodoxin-dependent (E)-4-hydroxy-3-methylbut-2-enyl-diphosphate synthase [Clostridiales bacterium]|nr:flavodoxin-dependent (E)-4-hydroxy-3-methylbut-2-enyl-diphosphate synthase [Clostridiales bacterium]